MVKLYNTVDSKEVPVSMRVTNENISRIRDVDPIGEVGDALTPDFEETNLNQIIRTKQQSYPILLTKTPSSVNTTTLWPWKDNLVQIQNRYHFQMRKAPQNHTKLVRFLDGGIYIGKIFGWRGTLKSQT